LLFSLYEEEYGIRLPDTGRQIGQNTTRTPVRAVDLLSELSGHIKEWPSESVTRE
jgi:hypothetical protein